MTERQDCGQCRYFDKEAFPKNTRFGACTFPVPPLPVWIKGNRTNYVADYYVDCKTFSPSAGPKP